MFQAPSLQGQGHLGARVRSSRAPDSPCTKASCAAPSELLCVHARHHLPTESPLHPSPATLVANAPVWLDGNVANFLIDLPSSASASLSQSKSPTPRPQALNRSASLAERSSFYGGAPGGTIRPDLSCANKGKCADHLATQIGAPLLCFLAAATIPPPTRLTTSDLPPTISRAALGARTPWEEENPAVAAIAGHTAQCTRTPRQTPARRSIGHPTSRTCRRRTSSTNTLSTQQRRRRK